MTTGRGQFPEGLGVWLWPACGKRRQEIETPRDALSARRACLSTDGGSTQNLAHLTTAGPLTFSAGADSGVTRGKTSYQALGAEVILEVNRRERTAPGGPVRNEGRRPSQDLDASLTIHSHRSYRLAARQLSDFHS
jgi:hypothetical protein